MSFDGTLTTQIWSPTLVGRPHQALQSLCSTICALITCRPTPISALWTTFSGAAGTSVQLLFRVVDCRQCFTENVARIKFCQNCGPAPRATPQSPTCAVGDLPTIDMANHRPVVRKFRRRWRAGRARSERCMLPMSLMLSSGLSRGGSGGGSPRRQMTFSFGSAIWTPRVTVRTWCMTARARAWAVPRRPPARRIPDAPRRHAADSLRQAFVSKLRMAYKELLHHGDDWDPVSRRGNPCSGPRVDSYLTYATKTQRQAGGQVNQAVPLLAHRLTQLLKTMRSRCTVAATVTEGIAIMRDVAPFAVAFYTMRRGFDISNTLESQVMSCRAPRAPSSTFSSVRSSATPRKRS